MEEEEHLLTKLQRIIGEPILGKILSLIFMFLFALMLMLSVETAFQQATHNQQRKIDNQRLRKELSDVLLQHLLKVEALAGNLLTATTTEEAEEPGNGLLTLCDEMDQTLRVLREGGEFREERDIRVDDKNEVVDVVINYSVSRQEYDIDGLSLVPKVADIRAIVEDMIGVSVLRFAAHDIRERDLQMDQLFLLRKEVQSAVLGSLENANHISYEVDKSIREMLDQQQRRNRQLMFFNVVLISGVAIFVVVLGAMLIRQAGTIIEARKQAEEYLRESENYLRTIFDTIQTGLVLIDPKTHHILDANTAAS